MFRNPFSSTTIGDENPIRTLGDYSKPSHEGYRNTIELPVGNNVVPLRSDTIRLVQNECSFHGLRSEDPNQHLKDFLKLVDSLDLDGENRERTRLRLFQFSLRDQASNWLERLPAGSITTWEDLTTRFLAQFFPPRRTAKLCNDILMFQQHHGESLSEAWTRFKDLLQKVPHHGIDLWLQSVKAITLPQDVPEYIRPPSNRARNQVQRLMEAHLAPTQPTQVNKVTTSCEICSGPHDTQYCMEDPEQAFVEYASSRTDEAGGKWYTFKPEKNNIGNTYNPSWRSHPNLRLVPPSSNTELICTKEEDGDITFIEIVPKDDISRMEEPEAGEQEVEYFDIFSTKSELTYHNTVMSDSECIPLRLTYTEVSSPFEGLSDIGLPGVVGPEQEGLPWMLDDLYVQDEVFLAKEQPLPSACALPTAQSPDFDDEDDDMDIKADDEEEEEEHPALADYVVVALPAADQAPYVEETEPFDTDEGCQTSRYIYSTIITALPMVFTTSPDTFSPLPPIPSPSLPVSPPLPVSLPVPVLSPSPPASLIRSLGYRAAMIRLRAEAASTSYSLPLPPPFILSHTRPSFHLLSTDHREDRPEVTLPPQKRLGIALGLACEVGESSSAAAARPAGGLRADYGFVATIDRNIRLDPNRDVGYGITDSWDEIVETLQDTDEIYTRLNDEQFGRQLLAGQLNKMFRDRRAHARTARLMETEARMSREAWGRSMDASDLARTEEALKLIKRLQTQMTKFERQQGPAKGPAHPELPEEAGSNS
ncbi:MAK10-like protein [Tanacetum coccineum]